MKFKKLISIFIAMCAFTLSACEFIFPSEEKYDNNLVIKSRPNKVVYNVNEAYSSEGLQVVDLQGQQVLDYTSSISEGTLLKKEGNRTVTLSKDGYRPANFTITVKAMASLNVANLPNKTEYLIGEYFNIEGLKITDERGVEITDYTLSYRVGDTFKSAGEIDIIVSKDGYMSTSFTVRVRESRRLVVTTMPKKTEYKVGDAFNSEGLTIGDNEGKNNLSYTLSIKDGDILKYSGTIAVSVSVATYSDITFDITVLKNDSSVTGKDKNVNIYYVNDVHGSFIRNTSQYEAGMAYFSKYFKEKKADENENAIILSGGDMFQGGVESNCTYGKIMVDAMNIAGFDAMALGNHEFDWGEDKIKEAQAMMEFPLLSCNTFYSSDRKTRPDWVKPYTIIERGDLKIGVVGFARSGMGSSILTSIANQFYFPSPNSYIKEYASMLRLSYNCDLVLAVGHDEGMEGSTGDPTAFEDLTLIDPKTNCSYVDGMFFAHDHTRKVGYYNEIPYCESGGNGRYLSHMKFELSYTGGAYSIKGKMVEVNSATSTCTKEDTEVTALLTKYADQIIDPDKVLCTFTRRYTKEEFCVVVCQAMVWYVNNNPSIFDNTTVYFASHNIQGIRNTTDIPMGNFTYRDLVEVCPFDNDLCIQKCTSRNIDSMSSSTYYRTYQSVASLPYTGSYTNAVTISYIAEYSSRYQTSYKAYTGYTAKVALTYFLQSGTPITTSF